MSVEIKIRNKLQTKMKNKISTAVVDIFNFIKKLSLLNWVMFVYFHCVVGALKCITSALS